MSDVLSGELPPAICNAAVNAGGKLLKVVEMQQRYGVLNAAKDGAPKELVLIHGTPPDPKMDRIRHIEEELAELRGGMPGTEGR